MHSLMSNQRSPGKWQYPRNTSWFTVSLRPAEDAFTQEYLGCRHHLRCKAKGADAVLADDGP